MFDILGEIMNICIFSANYLPNIGGVERYTYYVAKELVNRGHNVTVVTSNLFSLPSHEYSENIEIYRYDCYNLLNGRYPILKFNKLQKEIDRKLIENKFDLIIVNTRFYFHSIHAMKLAYKNKIKCICIEHGTMHLTVNNKLLDLIGGAFEHFLTMIDKHYCKDYYGVSHAACEWSGHFGIKSKGVLYNAVDPDEIEEILANPTVDYRKELNIKGDTAIIAYTGRLIPEKGIMQLVEAFEKINDTHNVALVLAGDGILFNAVKEKNIKNVYLLGKIDFKSVISLLKVSDVFCLPSRSEGFSTSALEAAIAECYIITTVTSGGTKELISDSNYGTLINSNSPAEIFKALSDILNNPQKMSKVKINAKQKVIDNFTFKKTVINIEDIVNEQ